MMILFAQWWTFALTYDPATNSYITDSGEEITTTSDDSDDQDQDDDDDSDEAVTSSVWWSTDDDESDNDASVQQTQSSVVPEVDRDGSLQYIHEQLDGNTKELISSLKSNYSNLRNEMSDLFTDGEQSRLDAMQCLNIIDDEFDIVDQVDTTYKQLRNKISIVFTDIHSEISALETKIDEWLLDDLDKKLQVAAAQNKVDAFKSEYANVINTFYDLSRDELVDVDLVVDAEKEKYGEILAVYDARVAKFEALEEAYAEFLSKSSFAWALAGPNMQELLDSINELETYYRSSFIADRHSNIGNHIPDNKTAFKNSAMDASLQAFSNSFSQKADNILGGLYPVQKIQLMHQSMLTMRSAYLQNNWSYDCQAFATNKTISTTADKLMEDMDTLLANLNEAVNKIAKDSGELPKTVEALKAALRTTLQNEGDAFIDILIDQEKTRIQAQANREWVSWLPVWTSSQSARRARTVRTFLQAQYKKSLDSDRLASFINKLENALDKIDDVMKEKEPEGRVKEMLEVIERVIREFL